MNKKEEIFIASDHAGFDLKEQITKNIFENEIIFKDLGTNNINSVDYPDYAKILCDKISKKKNCKGILICGTGIGMSIVANRYQNIRAALCLNEKMAKLSREHNNANVLVLGSRLISCEQAIKSIIVFLLTGFEGGRHQARLEKINNVKTM